MSPFCLDPDRVPDLDIFERNGSAPEWASSPCNCVVLLVVKVMCEKILECLEDVWNSKLGGEICDSRAGNVSSDIEMKCGCQSGICPWEEESRCWT